MSRITHKDRLLAVWRQYPLNDRDFHLMRSGGMPSLAYRKRVYGFCRRVTEWMVNNKIRKLSDDLIRQCRDDCEPVTTADMLEGYNAFSQYETEIVMEAILDKLRRIKPAFKKLPASLLIDLIYQT